MRRQAQLQKCCASFTADCYELRLLCLQALTYDSSTGRLLVVVEGADTGKGIMPYAHVSAATFSQPSYL